MIPSSSLPWNTSVYVVPSYEKEKSWTALGTVVARVSYLKTILSDLVPIPNNVGWGQSISPVRLGVPEYLMSVSCGVHVNPTPVSYTHLTLPTIYSV